MRNMKKLRLTVFTLIMLLVLSNLAYAAPVHKDLCGEVSADNIYNHIAILADRDDARQAGTEGEVRAADYIAGHMENFGLDIGRQEFPIVTFKDNGAKIMLVNPEAKEFQAKNLWYSASTPEDGITSEMVYCGKGLTPEDFPEEVKGKIALMMRGQTSFEEKVEFAAAAGAIGIIVFNNRPGVINASLFDPSTIPAVTMLQEDGLYLKELLDQGQAPVVNLQADCEIINTTSQNVVGTLKAGRGGKSQGTIILGAHMDCVDTPGANDNASGVGTMLEAARILSKQQFAYDIKFIAFGAEDIGLKGSRYYVNNMTEEELQTTAAMINMDMVGIGDTIQVMTVFEDADSFIADLSEVYLKKLGMEYIRFPEDAGDHQPFELAGIPSVFLNYGPDPYYHTDEDSLDKISKDNLYRMGTLVTTMIYDIAKTPMADSYNGIKAKVNKYNSISNELITE